MPFDLILAAHVQGKPVDEFQYGGLAGEEGFEPSNGGSKVRLSLGGCNVNSLLVKELPVMGGHGEAPADGSIASKIASKATA